MTIGRLKRARGAQYIARVMYNVYVRRVPFTVSGMLYHEGVVQSSANAVVPVE